MFYLFGSNQFMSCPWAMSFLNPAPFPPVTPSWVPNVHPPAVCSGRSASIITFHFNADSVFF